MTTRTQRTLTDLKPGDHLCLLYANDHEHRAIVTPFIRQGLERHEKVVYIVNANDQDTILDYLRDDHLPVETYIANGQFQLLTSQDAYLREGMFDPDKMIALLESETALALAQGFTALRLTGEMTWALQGLPGTERLIEYEIKLNQFFPTHRALAICQYDQRRFDANVLLDVLRTHPTVVLGTTLFDNPYYLPPKEILGNRIADATLDRWIGNIKNLGRTQDDLMQRVQERTAQLVATNAELEMQLVERQRAEIRREALLAINRMTQASEKEILDFALEQSLKITASRVGYIYHYSEATRLFTLNSWSQDVMHECTILEPQTIYELDKTGIWGEAVRQRKPILVNDFDAPNELKKGYPEGHVRLTRYMTIPVFEDDHLVAVVGVGNKVAPYNQNDENELTLFIQGVWNVLRWQRDEQAIHHSAATARAILDSVFESLILLEADGTVVEINDMGAQRLGQARADLIGKNIYDYLPAEIVAARRQKVDLAFQTNQSLVFEDERAGRVIKQSIIAISGNANQKKRLAIFAQDITEQKRIEAEIRQTADLLEATRNAQSLYLTNGNLVQVAGQLLQTLCRITSSEYGFLDEVLRDEDGKLYKRSLAMSNLAWDAGSQKLYETLVNNNLEFRNSNNLASAPIVTGELVIANDRAHDPRSGGLPAGHPMIDSFMGIPLYFGDELVGVVGVANRNGGYSQAIAKFLEPFTTTCASIIYAARKDRREKEINAALEHSEERFRIISEVSNDFAFSFRVLPNGNLYTEWITDSYDQICGFTIEQRNPHGDTPFATVYPADLPALEQTIREHIATHLPGMLEFRIVSKSGALHTLKVQFQPIWDEQQQRVVRLVGGGSDITARKQAEQELEVALTKYKTLFDTFPLGITISGAQGQILEANPEAEHLVGLTSKQHTQRTIDGAEWQIIRPDGSPMPAEEYASVRALKENRRIENIEMGLVKPGQATTWINVTAAPIALPGYGVAVTYNDISARKQAEAALRESQERFHVAQELSLDAFTILTAVRDAQHTIIDFVWEYVNPEAGRLLRQPAADLVNKRLLQVLPGNQTNSDLFDRYVRVVETGEPHDYELCYESDGIQGWFRNMTVKLGDGIAVYFSDITARKQTELALRESESRYRKLFTEMINGFALHEIICDNAGNPIDYVTLEVNPAFESLLNAPRALVVNQKASGTLPPKELSHWLAIFGPVALTGKSTAYEMYSPLNQKHFEGIAYCPEKGKFAVNFADVTKRKEAENALRESEEKYHNLYRDAALGISHATLDGRYLDMNPALAHMLGYSTPEEAIASIYDIAEQTYAEPSKRDSLVQQAIQTGGAIQFENDYRRRDGTIWNGLVHLRVVRDAQGQPSYLESFVEDITERNRIEKDLRESEWRNKTVSNLITDYVFVVDVEPSGLFRLRWASDNMLRMTGRTIAEAATPDLWRDIIHPDDTDRFFEFARQVVTTAQPGELECRTLYKNGDIRWIQIFAQPLSNDTNAVHTIVGAIKDITERKAQEQALRDSEERYRTLIETANEGVWTIDTNAMTTFVNTKMAEMLGYTSEEMFGKSLYEFMDDEGRKLAEHNFERRRQGIAEQHDFKFQRKDGQPIWCLLSTNPLKRNGQFVGALATISDISDRKKAQDELQRLNLYHRNLIETSLDPLVTIMPNGKIGDVNMATEIVTGYTRTELIDTDFADYFTEPAKARAGYQQVFAEGMAQDYELAIQHKDGHITPVLYNATVYRDQANQIVGVFAAARDMTARKLAEANLRTSMLQWQTTFDAIPDAICLLDRDMRIERTNQAMSKLLHKDPNEILGQTCCQAVHNTDEPILNCPFVRMSVSHRREQLDVLVGNAWYIVTADPLFNEQGELTGAIHTMHDITERKKLEDQNQHNNQHLNQLVRQLSEQNLQITLLSELGDLLQTCQTLDEAYTVIPRFAQKLFPDQTGALFMRNATQNLIEAVATWGNLTPVEQVFPANECWALRRNRTHADTDDGLACAHVRQPATPHLCIPLFSQNELFGMLHLRATSAVPPAIAPDSTRRSLAENMAEHLALALSNLRLQQVLREQAIRDPLTGLHNRRYMEETLEREIRRSVRSQQPVSIISIDLDHLKDINDHLGHEAGDQALRQFGNLLKQSIRSADVACRFGGDEFLLILADAGLEHARQRAEELNRATHALVISRPDLEPIHLSMSAGVAECPLHGTYPQSILRAADAALYRAKTAGRDCVIVAET